MTQLTGLRIPGHLPDVTLLKVKPVGDQAAHQGEHHCRGQAKDEKAIDSLDRSEHPPALGQFNVPVAQCGVMLGGAIKSLLEG